MLLEKVIERSVRAGAGITADRSRCLRMRFNGCSCSRCVEQCWSDAIVIGDDLRVKADRCSQCMVCVSACPADSFAISGFDFTSAAGRLRQISHKVPSPIVGCTARTNAACHVRTPCFGFLSEAHLMALAASMPNPLQIDMTGCTDCENRFIAGIIEQRVNDIGERTGLHTGKKIRLVVEKNGLDFHEISYDRRGFFSALKTMTFSGIGELFGAQETGETQQSYSAKKLPLKRDLLNRILKTFADDAFRGILSHYYYTVRTTQACDNCFACVGMCPTGALNTAEGQNDKELEFRSALCSGCGLCESFCMKKALVVEKGYKGLDPTQPIMARTGSAGAQ